MDFIPLNELLLNGNEKKYLCECIDAGWISSEGPFVKEFEQKMSAAADRKYGVAVSNGTAALEVAVQALEIGEGDEVIMTAFIIISCAMAVTKVGAVPVLVDSDLYTWNMNIDEIDNKIIQKLLAEEGIGSRTFFWCMHEQPVYQREGLFVDETYPNAEYLARKGFYIPSGLALTEEQMDRVIVGMHRVMAKV